LWGRSRWLQLYEEELLQVEVGGKQAPTEPAKELTHATVQTEGERYPAVGPAVSAEELEAEVQARANEVTARATGAVVEQARTPLAAELEHAKRQLARAREVTFKCDTKHVEAQTVGGFLSKAEHEARAKAMVRDLRQENDELVGKLRHYMEMMEEPEEEWWETDTSRDGVTVSEGAEEELGSEEESEQEAELLPVPGAKVRLRDRTIVPELNGQWGTVEAYDKKKGRQAVQVFKGGTKVLRPENLHVQWAPRSGSGQT